METEGTEKTLCDGAKLLADFIESRGITLAAAGDGIGVSKTAVIFWLRGDQRPRDSARKRIATWTSGAVPAESWETPEERIKAAGITPFTPKSTSSLAVATPVEGC